MSYVQSLGNTYYMNYNYAPESEGDEKKNALKHYNSAYTDVTQQRKCAREFMLKI